MSRSFKKFKRNKKLMIILAVFLMSLTLGYSLLAATKSINGHSLFANSKWDIHWDSDSVEVLEGSVNTDSPYVSDDGRILSYAANLKIPGDYYEFTIDAVNAGTIDGMLNIESALPIVKTSTGEVIELPSYLKYTITYADGTEIEKNHLLAKRLDETHPTREKYKIKLEFDRETDTLPDKEISIEIENDVPYDQATDEARERDKRELKKYIVTFNPKGGTVEPTTKEVEEEGRYGTLPTPTKAGYTFLGWYLNNEKITSKDEVKITSNVTLEAKYRANEYKITYKLNGGVNSENNPNGYNVDTETITLENPNKTGYIFKGWTGSNGTTPQKNVQIPKGSTGDKNYEANWEQGNYTITYNLNGGENSGLNPSSYTIDSNDIVLEDPSKEGYTFQGWTTTGLDTPTKNIKIPKGSTGNRIYEAHWKVITYKITYALNNGTDNKNNPISYTIETETITLQDPTRSGYTFTGWTGSNGTTPQKNVQIPKGSTGDKTYTSNWTTDSYTITYNLDGGTNHSSNPLSYTIDTDTITLQNPTRTGYTFRGWTGEGITTPQKNVQIPKGSTGNKEYTANWEIITYQIKYIMDSGTNNPNNPTTYTVETETITLQNPTRTGYTFQGWTTPSTTTPEKNLTIPKGSTENKTFYAHWQLNTYSITYTMNNGINHEDNPTSYTIESNNITLRNPTKTLIFHGNVNGTGATITNNDKTAHQIFAGWTGSNGNSPQKNVIIAKGSTGNKIYTAHWTAVAGTLPIIKKNGYDCGWSTSNAATTKEYDSAATFPTSAITEDMQTTVNLYAVCTRNTYTITYNLGGGTNNENNPASYNVETATITLQDPTKSGYTFQGWTGEGITTPTKNLTIPKESTGNKTYTANWNKNTYTIAYNLYGGTNNENNPSGYDVETSTITLQDPTKTGYTFTGWTGEGITTPTKNITIPKGSTGNKTYTANWSKDTYTISYTLNGGTNHSNNPSSYQVDTATITLGYPTREGYTFTGWTGSNGTTPQKTVTIPKGSTGNKSYTANWTTDTYTITYNLGGGTNNSNNPSSYNVTTNTITLSDPTREGYTFTGWTGNGTIVPTKNLTLPKGSTGNKTFTANWDKIIYTITYNLNGGTNSINNPLIYDIETETIILENPTREGYIFTGWTGEGIETPTKNLTIPKGSIGNKTYMANWVESIAKFDIGENVNKQMKKLAGSSNATYIDTDSRITSFNKSMTAPDLTTMTSNNIVSASDSKVPIYAWYENNGIKWWSEAKTVYFNEDTSNFFRNMSALNDPYIAYIDSSKVTNMSYMFAGCSGLQSLNHYQQHLNTSNVTDMSYMYLGCNNLNMVNIGAYDTSKVTNISYMFAGCSDLQQVEMRGIDLSHVTNIEYFFGGCTVLYNVYANSVKFNNLSIKIFSNTGNGYEYIYLTDADTSLVTDMKEMFAGCLTLKLVSGLDTIDTTHVTDMSKMFLGCKKLSNSVKFKFDTSNVTNMSYMFTDCASLLTIDLTTFNTSKVTDMSYMFINCTNVESITGLSGFDTSKVTNMYSMFNNCSSITELDLSSFRTPMTTNMSAMLYGMTSLETLDLSNIDFRSCNTSDPLMMYISGSGFSSLETLIMNDVKFSENMTYGLGGLNTVKTIYLENVDTSNITNMTAMFNGNTELTTIYVTDSFVVDQVTASNDMFNRDTKLVGGNGTTYDSTHIDKEYAHYDYGPSDPGYFNARPDNIYEITLNPNGGSVSETTRKTIKNGKIGPLPVATTTEEYAFDGWYTSITGGTKVDENYIPTENITIYARWKKTFATDSWTTIVNNAQSGTIPSYYHVGDEKEVDLGSIGKHKLRIANLSSPTSCTNPGYSQTACGFVLEFKDVITQKIMNPYNSDAVNTNGNGNKGSWKSTVIREYINSTIYDAFPTVLKEAIVDTTAVTGHGPNDPENFKTVDKLYLFTPTEVTNFSESGATDVSSTRQLDYYMNNSTIGDGTMKRDSSNTIRAWWTRTPYKDYDSYFYYVSAEGTNDINYSGSEWNYGYVSPAFRIGPIYTINYDANGGTADTTTRKLMAGNELGILPTPAAPTGYVFDGWYTGLTDGVKVTESYVPSGNQALYARWKIINYTISYTLNGGTNNANNPSSYNVTSNAISLQAPTKTLTFKGNTNSTSGANGTGVTITNNNRTAVQTFAGWTGSNGSTNQTSVTIASGSTGNKTYTSHWNAVAGTLPTVSKGGYICGWSTSQNGTSIMYQSGGTFPTSAITENMNTTVNLYAVCVALKVGDYIQMTPTKSSYTVDTSKTGSETTAETMNPRELTLWRIIRKNSDNTFDAISEYTTQKSIEMKGYIAYKYYTGYLNVLASQYENSDYTKGSRNPGYNGQTETITNSSKFDGTNSAIPWTSSTTTTLNQKPSNEYLGGGDTLYSTDVTLIRNVYGTISANNKYNSVSPSAKYYLSSREYTYSANVNGGTNSIGFFNSVVASSNDSLYYNQLRVNHYGTRWSDSNNSWSIRPILVFKNTISPTSGSGTKTSPYVLN